MKRTRPAPPRPRLVIRIGVTGHRPNRFPEEGQQTVRQKLRETFTKVADAALELHQREHKVFDPRPPEIRVVSALAEGADRVVAETALEAGFVLDVVLPFPAEVYEQDFESHEAKERYHELLGKARVRFSLPGKKSSGDPAIANRAYEAAGLVTLRQCDLLIAVWDGREASGRGGTEDMVQRSVESGRPVLWFHPDGHGPYLLVGSTVTPSDARDLAERAAADGRATDSDILNVIDRISAPPAKANCDATQKTAKKAHKHLLKFLNEWDRRFTMIDPWYPLLLSLFSDKKGFWKSIVQSSYIKGVEQEWDQYWRLLGSFGTTACLPLHETLMPRFAWADKLADRYGMLHRSCYVRNYLLAALAVLFAAMVINPDYAWAPLVEFAAITVIALATGLALLGKWHQKWLDYRNLSAQLRHMRALALVGSSPGDAGLPHIGEELRPGPLWVNWYCRMTAREIGLLDLHVDATYIEAAKVAFLRAELENQRTYHQNNMRQMKSVARWLDGLSIAAFVVTFLICAYEVVGMIPPYHWLSNANGHEDKLPHMLFYLSVVLPAFGAALFGIRMSGDFEGSSERSHDMTRRLGVIEAQLESKTSFSFAELSAITEYTAVVMASEIGDWSFVYQGRPLALPT